MTDLQIRLADANPVTDDDLAPSFEEVWRRFEQATVPERQRGRELPLASMSGQRRRARWATLGVGAVAVAVAVLVVGTTGGGPQKALAGWSADPTTPATGQLQTAESACQRQNPSTASLVPTVADVRGPYSMLVYVESRSVVECIAGSQGTLMSSISAPPTNSAAPSAVAITSLGNTVIPGEQDQAASQLRAEGDTASVLVGQAGTGVTAVTLTLDDGTTVQSTTTNGWFAAWWPGSQMPHSAAMTTPTGTSTQPLVVPGGPAQTQPPSPSSGGAS
jgi:hypothetical protein